MFQLRDYQQQGAYLGSMALALQKRTCLAAPMGTGKSVIELAIQAQDDNYWIVTPRVEIIKGMLEKKGLTFESEQDLLDMAWALKITTPIRLRNALIAGRMTKLPSGLIIDEGHHIEAETYQQILLCCGKIGVVLFTATPFRGTPKSTASFRETWGEPVWLLTYNDAVKQGYMKLPRMQTVPLVDDDIIEIGSNGELMISSIEAATKVRLHSIVDLIRPMHQGSSYDKPTIVSLPSTNLVHALAERLHEAGLPYAIVVQDTPYKNRQAAFAATLASQAILLQINVVSEGVDLPLRRLIDASPTLSPVKWTQQVGRITRPTEDTAEYLCTNRNLMRHAYVLDGIMPASALLQAQEAFPLPSSRAGSRVVGLEALGRLKPATVRLGSGLVVTTYAVSTSEESKVVEYFAILHPRFPDPVWAKRVDTKDAAGSRIYGKWVATEPPKDLQGFASIAPKAISEKQEAWWVRSARHFGLDAETKPTRKEFQILPVLKDLGLRLAT